MAVNLALIPLADKIIDGIRSYFPSAEQAEKAKQSARNAIIENRVSSLNAELQAIVMEAQSEDPWTSRARPTFLYVVYFYILMAIPMGILALFSPQSVLEIGAGIKVWLNSIPEQMWYLFGVGYLGYTGARTYDKGKQADIKIQEKKMMVIKPTFDQLPPQGNPYEP